MSNEMVTQLPTVTNALLSDILYAVQGYISPSSPGTSVQETWQQGLSLIQSNLILNFAGNPNGNVAGTVYQFCWDTTDKILFICTTTGSTSTAVWTALPANIISPAFGGSGIANPTAHAILIGEGTNHFNSLSLTNGQIPIGFTGSDPVASTITAGTGITVNNSAGSITISTSGSGVGWIEVTGTSQAMTSNFGFITNNSGLVTLSLPISSSVGDVIYVIGKGSGGWDISQGNSPAQQIHVGGLASTSGSGGSISSTNQYNSITLVCTIANTTWTTLGAPQGNITVV